MRPLGFDTETHLIAPGRTAPRLVCLQTWDGETLELMRRDEALVRMRELLADPDVLLVGCNTAFDLAVFCQADPTFFDLSFKALEAGRVWDVALFDLLVDIALGRFKKAGAPSLASLAQKYLGHDRSAEKKAPDAWRLRYAELESVPVARWPEEAVAYCKDDARDPLCIFEKQLEAANNSGGLPPMFAETVRHAFAFRLMSAWGIRTDGDAVEALRSRLEAIMSEATPKLKEARILRDNGSENQSETKRRIREILGDGAPLTVAGIKKLDAGETLTEPERLKYTRTASEILELCKDDAALSLWLSVQKDRKELSSFVPKLFSGVRYPINARINTVVSSFRTSCSIPNLQQQPRRPGVRECFVPRAGYVFVSCDYAVAELCSLAQVLLDLFGSSAMADELNAGRDLHCVFGSDLAGMSYQAFLASYKAKDPRAKELRQAAKPANFGIPGGLGAARLAELAKDYGVHWSPEDAVRIRRAWLDRFPEMREYFNLIAGKLRGGLFTHKHPRTGFIRGAVGFCDGCNQGFQHLTAAGAKDAAYDVSRECYLDTASPLFGSRPVLFVHDELILEVPEFRLSTAAVRLESVMVSAMQRYTPDVVCKAEASAMRRWYKDAEPVYDAAGVLVCWDPYC